MKRLHSCTTNQSIAVKTKYEGVVSNPACVFRITKVEQPILTMIPKEVADVSKPKENEVIFTEEQLARMTPKQQYSCFQTQAYEIKQLRRKLRKVCQKRGKLLEAEIYQAHEQLQNCDFELPDQKYLIENLIKALKAGSLAPNTFQYDHLCTIVRNTLNLKTEKGSAKCIRLPDKELPITERERKEYMQLPNNVSLIKVLVGQPNAKCKVSPEEEQKREVERYLAIHGELFKRMTFRQFLASIKASKKGYNS